MDEIIRHMSPTNIVGPLRRLSRRHHLFDHNLFHQSTNNRHSIFHRWSVSPLVTIRQKQKNQSITPIIQKNVFLVNIVVHILVMLIMLADESQIFVMCSIKIDTRHEFHTYENITPMVILANGPTINLPSSETAMLDSDDSLQSSGLQVVPLSNNISCNLTLTIQIDAFKSRFVINLEKNKRLISDRFFQVSHSSRGFKPIEKRKQYSFSANSRHNKDSATKYSDDHCHYHGLVNNQSASLSAISIVGSALSGFFYDGQDMYLLNNVQGDTQTTVYKSSGKNPSETSDAFSEEDNYLSIASFKEALPTIRSKRSISKPTEELIKHEPYGSNSTSLFVELLIVHDHSQYMDYKKNNTVIAERTMQIVNIMNAFYKQLNIFISLVGVVLWTEKDEIKLTDDGDATLTSFLKYRYEKLLPKYHHDNAQLITSTSFNGSVVGKALKGPICTFEHSGGVNTDHSHNPAVVAATLAHELGHNFGMQHDEEGKCKCPDDKCIMSASSSPVHPKHWSSCSIEYLEDSRKHGYLDCLKNKPLHLFGPICGNGFVEEGEDCDPGISISSLFNGKNRKNFNKNCTEGGPNCDIINPCCDRLTCKFTKNSTCSDGPCCDRSTCTIYNTTITKVCRPRQSDCDLEEVCDGLSEFCPDDVHYHDGIECGPSKEEVNPKLNFNRTRAHCYKGKCASHESQCQLLWGPTGQVSKDLCFNQNIQGNTSGNCGYDRRVKIYKPCEEEDKFCGMLHCIHQQQEGQDIRGTGKLEYGFELAALLSRSYFTQSNKPNINCRGAIIDAGPGIRDPGLVPDGAACGDQRMCVNQKCVSLEDIFAQDWCPSGCNDNGICDNKGMCHCSDGTIGTSCFRFFSPGFHLTVALYMILFFVPLVALIIYVINHFQGHIKTWWFLQNRKKVLKNRAKETNHNRRNIKLPQDVDRNNINISAPIPVYDPTVDPWADESASYKLDTIRRDEASNMTSTPNGKLKPVRAAPAPPQPPARPFVRDQIVSTLNYANQKNPYNSINQI